MQLTFGQKIQAFIYLVLFFVLGYLTFRNIDGIKNFFYRGKIERQRVESYTPFDQGVLFAVDNRMPSTSRRNLSCKSNSEWFGVLGSTDAYNQLLPTLDRSCTDDSDCGVIVYSESTECPPIREPVSVAGLQDFENEFSVSAVQYFNYCGGVTKPVRGINVPVDCRFAGGEKNEDVGFACVKKRCEIITENIRTKELFVAE